jgi:hypothetical protein
VLYVPKRLAQRLTPLLMEMLMVLIAVLHF